MVTKELVSRLRRLSGSFLYHDLTVAATAGGSSSLKRIQSSFILILSFPHSDRSFVHFDDDTGKSKQ